MTKPKIAILVSFSGQGGVERMIANLARALVCLDIELDILLIKQRGPHVAALPDNARVIALKSRHSATSVFEVARYLRDEQPSAMLAVKHRGILAALKARRLARTDTPISGRLGTTVSAALANASSLRRWSWFRAMRRNYRHLHRVIAVSEGVASDIHQITGLESPQLTVIRNPVITDALMTCAQQQVEHPFFDCGEPVIVAAGRLTRQKGFDTLLEAFARLNAVRSARLIILGEGEDRHTLLTQAMELGVAERVDMPGFQSNPWAWMQQSQLFVLSSRWEGSPNSLTEAMALGVPVVSTDCPSGPRELLAAGTVAPLVPMDAPDALAEAMTQTLESPPEAESLKNAVAQYHATISASAYLAALLRD